MQKFQTAHLPIYSPDTDVFSTPPSTPGPTASELRPSLSRRSSRPSSLQLSHTAAEWNTSIVLDNQPSPSPTTLLPRLSKTDIPSSPAHISTNPSSNGIYMNGVNNHPATSLPSANGRTSMVAVPPHSVAPTPTSVTYETQPQPSSHLIASSPIAQTIHNHHNHQQHHHNQHSTLSQHLHPPQPHHNTVPPHSLHPQQSQPPQSQETMAPAMTSPCLVHSQLQGASIGDWFREKQKYVKTSIGLGGKYEGGGRPNGVQEDRSHHRYVHNLAEEESTGSLTEQLAETAVGVREMSKQLGRTRVRSLIQSILIVTKARDNRLIKLTRELALYLMLKPQHGGRGLVVYVDSQLKTSRRFDASGIEQDHPELFLPYPRRSSSGSSSASSASSVYSNKDSDTKQQDEEGQLRYWTPEMCSRSPQLFDFVVTLGGDGTVLFTSWLFQRIVPPVLPFALGSLGFLTNFDFSDHQSVMDFAIESGIRVNLRMRFTCTVYRAVSPAEAQKNTRFRRKAIKKAETGEILMKNLEKGGWEALESGYSSQVGKCAKDKEIMCFTTRPVESFEVLNDLVVDRGPSPYVSLLELFGDEHHLTTVQADGLTISTPTGSTAYSLSAGGSLVHPEIPAILITPICPHTLSFRPMLLPDSMELRICVPFNSRSTAWASFDGRGRVELKQGDHIKVTASRYPFPTVCADSQSVDWFHSISRTLKWNERERQKSFVVVEEGPSSKRNSITKKVRKRRSATVVGSTAGTVESKIPPIPDTRGRSKSVGSIDGPFGEKGKENEEEDEASSSGEEEEEDEEEKFDIDDLSSNDLESSPKSGPLSSMSAAEEAIQSTRATTYEERVGREKAMENETNTASGRPGREKERDREQAQAEIAARSLAYGNPHIGSLLPAMRRKTRSTSRGHRSSRSRSRSGLRSGLETPDRFAGPHPHPPKLSPRHVQFMNVSNNSSSTSINELSGSTTITPEMERDQTATGILRKNFFDGREENMKTPTVGIASVNGETEEEERRGRDVESVAETPYVRRAFAVWGQDESDSATSDSDSGS